MKSPRVCECCGRQLPSHAPEGLCPKCLLDAGAAEWGIALEVQNPQCALRSGESEVGGAKREDGAQNSGVGGPQSVVHGQKPEARGQRFGNYELLEKVGEGGVGVVYKARQTNLDRIVAVKLLLFGQFNRVDVVQRFRTESTAAASLQHPNIVAIHDVGEGSAMPPG